MSTRSLILNHALPLVPFEGWSERMLTQAANGAGVDAFTLKRSFPRGAYECLELFLSQADEALPQLIPAEEMATLNVPQKIERLILARLQYFLPHREAVRRAISVQSLPWNLVSAASALGKTSDVMWRLAGDTSTDFNYYTKRMTLMTVYSTTLLFWLNDTSDDFEDTRAFLKRRLTNVADFGKWKKEMLNKTKRFV